MELAWLQATTNQSVQDYLSVRYLIKSAMSAKFTQAPNQHLPLQFKTQWRDYEIRHAKHKHVGPHGADNFSKPKTDNILKRTSQTNKTHMPILRYGDFNIDFRAVGWGPGLFGANGI